MGFPTPLRLPLPPLSLLLFFLALFRRRRHRRLFGSFSQVGKFIARQLLRWRDLSMGI